MLVLFLFFGGNMQSDPSLRCTSVAAEAIEIATTSERARPKTWGLTAESSQTMADRYISYQLGPNRPIHLVYHLYLRRNPHLSSRDGFSLLF